MDSHAYAEQKAVQEFLVYGSCDGTTLMTKNQLKRIIEAAWKAGYGEGYSVAMMEATKEFTGNE